MIPRFGGRVKQDLGIIIERGNLIAGTEMPRTEMYYYGGIIHASHKPSPV